jgi:alpha,alpha-trehalase
MIRGAIFDTDGVITDTAAVHERAWRGVLDDAARGHGVADRPFTHEDYLEHLDGRPRYDGVAAFLASREIDLPFGDPSDSPSADTVCGIGNRKNERFLDELRSNGVGAYPSTVELVRVLRRRGVRVAVISASRNCAEVLAAAGVADLFEQRVDGVVAAELALAGKPDPAVFVEAADRLGVEVDAAAIIEDSRAGVVAGHRGGFGLVVGIDRTGPGDALRSAGAHLVVSDLAEIRVLESGHWSKERADE